MYMYVPDYLRANLRLNLDLLTKFPFGIVLDLASLPIWNVFGVNEKGGCHFEFFLKESERIMECLSPTLMLTNCVMYV